MGIYLGLEGVAGFGSGFKTLGGLNLRLGASEAAGFRYSILPDRINDYRRYMAVRVFSSSNDVRFLYQGSTRISVYGFHARCLIREKAGFSSRPL